MNNHSNNLDLLQNIIATIDAYGMLDDNDRWLVAVSGGPDSMALLYALVDLRTRLKRLQGLHIAHLNHKLRGRDSDLDAECVARHAQKLNLPVTIEAVDIVTSQESGESIETTARRLRYDFLQRTAIAQKCTKIALAHNADDNIETVLHRFVRGTGIRGLAGIPFVRDVSTGNTAKNLKIVRPLLNVKRTEVEAFLQQHSIEARLDKSNLSNDYTRNRLRNQLLPLLRQEFNPQVDQAIGRLSRIAEAISDEISDDGRELLADLICQRTSDQLVVDAQKLRKYNRLRQSELIHQMLCELDVPLRDIGYRQQCAFMNLLNGDQTQSINLPGDVRVSCDQNKLTLQRCPAQDKTLAPIPGAVEIPLVVPGKTNLTCEFLCLTPGQEKANVLDVVISEFGTVNLQQLRQHDSYSEAIDIDKTQGSLRIRFRQYNDRICPLGAPGEKTLGDFFTDMKVPPAIRPQLALVCDDLGPIWVIGLRIADRVKVTENTQRLLWLKAQTRQ